MKKMKQIPSGFEPYVNKVEVARRLNKTVRTVDNWMLHGRIPYYKIGRSVVFKFSEVEKMLFETSGIVNPKTTINPSKETDGHIHELEESERIIK